ncbi:myosin-2 heavy chain-like [Rhopilema esculentum]|uniref:myosin-2 heavy chain-like n=1 Tax=Rhopilema esculentum TaxID=499914 RepID=UPI0031D21DBB|eukprot:gene6451-11897_t
MAAVAIAKPRKKPKSDRVEPFDDTASEASLPSISQRNSRPGSAWSAKDEDENGNVSINGESSEIEKKAKREDILNEQERSSINGSRGMLQKMRKNVVAPVDEEPTGSDSITRINVIGKRDVPEAWDNPAHEADSDSIASSRPGSAPLYRQPKPAASRPISAPQGRLVKQTGKDGPYKHTDTDIVEESALPKNRPSTSQSVGKRAGVESSLSKHESVASYTESRAMSRTGSREGQLSTKTASSESMLAPPVASGEPQAYIPYDYAKDCIAKVVDNMKRMKGNHLKVVERIQDQYKVIEEHTQGQFNDYVIKLRMEYNEKVGTFKRIIEIHQAELKKSQDFWQNSVKSLKEKNKMLLEDRKKYLTKYKDEIDNLEEEKVTSVKHLTRLLDQKHTDYLNVLNKLKEEETKREELESNLRQESEKEEELQKQISEGQKKSGDEKERLEKELEEKSANVVALESEKDKAETTLKDKEDENNKLKESILELEAKLKEFENRPLATVGVVTSASLLEKDTVKETDVQKSEAQNEAATMATSTTGLVVAGITTEESNRMEKRIKELENELNETEKAIKKFEKENTEQSEAILKLRSQSGNNDMAVIELKRENESLKERLKVAVSQMADSIDIGDVKSRMEAANAEKADLVNENNGFKEQLEKWKAEFREEHDGKEPAEDDRTEEIEGLVQEIKSNDEKLRAMNADIAVMKLLLGEPVDSDDGKESDSSDGNEEIIKKLVEEKNSLLDELDDVKREARGVKEELDERNDENANLKEEIQKLESEKEELEAKIEELSRARPGEPVIVAGVSSDISVAASGAESEHDSAESEGLRAEIEELNKSLEQKQIEYETIVVELNSKIEESQKSIETTMQERDNFMMTIQELEGKMENEQINFDAQLAHKLKEIEAFKLKIEELEAQRLSNLPVDAAEEVKALQTKLKTLEDEKESMEKGSLDSKATAASLNLNIDKLNKMIEKEKARNEQLQTEKQKSKDESDKKIKDLEQKLTAATTAAAASRKQSRSSKEDTANTKALQKKVDNLEKQLAQAKEKIAQAAQTPVKETREPKGPSLAEEKLKKENDKLNEKIEAFKKASKEDRDKIKTLQVEIKEVKEKAAKAGPSAEDRMAAKKQEKQMKDLQKNLETEKKRTDKLKEDLTKTEEDLANLKKELSEANSENKKKEDELSKLGVAAKQGAEAMAKVEELQVTCKTLTDENKTLTENYNSERVLRKKYYNMVEDMKGKIRVYARCRPLSTSEKERGNYSAVKSPDEYSLIVDTHRGPKEFQYDSVFMPDSTQEKVFEDTSMLIQSAVDGYNVCIFAYGQTGSGKTFTVIGDKEQRFPGIAPRAFQNLFQLLEENKAKFAFKVELYMMELYMDRLIDLFATNKDAKLDIKKDKKGMVIVQGAVIHEAKNSEELMSLFEKGSSTRHVSSTKMNAESSRSHLIISIIIEATNRTTGTVSRGKLSLVDLAGSERAAKTEASPEQLKEAQSINKSLSALGDVISALSSEQSFIPYRNNKLTLLMQDSLGGNAKTLMFVNISPADYNTDETITSLTYASRVKLITNDASKNAESKEVARLKGIITKLKKGENVEEEVADE